MKFCSNTGQWSLGEYDDKAKINDLPMAFSLTFIQESHSWTKTKFSDIAVVFVKISITFTSFLLLTIVWWWWRNFLWTAASLLGESANNYTFTRAHAVMFLRTHSSQTRSIYSGLQPKQRVALHWKPRWCNVFEASSWPPVCSKSLVAARAGQVVESRPATTW